MTTNLTSAFMLSQAAYPEMKKVGCGKIINIGSIAAYLASPGTTALGSSKAGIIQLARTCASAWTKDNIQAVHQMTFVTDDHVAEGRTAMADITGGCLCGRVRYVATGNPAFSGTCHCRNCQRYTGSAFEAFIAMPTASVSTTGELKTFEHPGGSGRPVYRRFCPNCGSGVINVIPMLV
jgi:NAD(P)-dependent dehydrogenase (short-subunit alcohol dehydrogenase family)